MSSLLAGEAAKCGCETDSEEESLGNVGRATPRTPRTLSSASLEPHHPMKIIIHPAIEEARLSALQQAALSIQFANCETPDSVMREISDADAFLGKLTPPMLQAAKQLRWVQSLTVSLEHYVFPALVEHPCVMTNMRGLFSDVIADQVMGYVVCFARNLHLYIRNQVARKWEPCGGEGNRVHFGAGPGVVNAIDRAHLHLSEMTLGIIGFGFIGREIGRRAAAFNLRVRAVDPLPQDRPEFVESLEDLNALDDLLKKSDFVVIAAPHTPDTVKMFSRELFQKMKPESYLINIGRGAIVVLDDLVEALNQKWIAGAALDVFETEPLPANHPLWDFPNVILTPHVAGYSPRIAERHLNVLLENVRRFARGEPLMNVVNKAMWF